MKRRAQRLGEIEALAAQFLKEIDARPILACPHVMARFHLKMRRIAYLDRSFTPDAYAIAHDATLLYGVDRDALRHHPRGQEGLKSDLAKRLQQLKERVARKYRSTDIGVHEVREPQRDLRRERHDGHDREVRQQEWQHSDRNRADRDARKAHRDE